MSPERPTPLALRVARQRWRITFRRDAAAATIGGRDLQGAIEASLADAKVPVVGHTQLAAGLAAGLAAERELLDVVLAERWPVGRARDVIGAALPPGHELVDCHDVWLGEPALAAQACGADYRAVLGADAPSCVALRDAATILLDAPALERTRLKGGRSVPYDLRPLLRDIHVSEGPPIAIEVGVVIDPERGTGRPEEVVAALADALALPEIPVERLVRTRLHLRGEADAGPERPTPLTRS
jgi:hypothetical protein